MFKLVDDNDVPRRERKIESRFAPTPEWAKMKAQIEAGIPSGKAIQVTLTEDNKTTYRITNRRTIVVFIKKYLTDSRIKNLHVSAFQRDGLDYVVVKHKAKPKR